MIFLILGFAMAANLKAIRQVYSYFRKASDGCDGKADGFGGSLSPKSLADIFKLLKIVKVHEESWTLESPSPCGFFHRCMNFLEIKLKNSFWML